METDKKKRDRKLGWDIRDSEARQKKKKGDNTNKQETKIFKRRQIWDKGDSEVREKIAAKVLLLSCGNRFVSRSDSMFLI